ncbi:hypothetical protein DXC13_09345 [Agathobacter rectalis]|jgi:hypothetical protein|uniref:Uncharacterized protein n=2 Tax=Agathobacter rectalis TaxID=39491 RepID=A0A3E4X2M1_9FIRM|nr:hypothetical protein [Agathobacter rectalis]RGM48736.1 hypothetical protein DXC13_09345 [Agathobacter rectalis]
MERTSYLLQIIIDYMFNNNLSIDKATFFTVIIGQITIYGILLTFYQFVASYQGGEKAATRYLGINITEYFVKKKIKIFNKIISKKMFGVLLILEILYKPFMTIYGETLGTSTISIINFVWFLFAIVYFILFVMLFIQCTKSILMIKMSSDIKRNGYIISEINKEFLKKTMKERISKNAIDLLRRDFVNLHDAIQEDENTELQGRYNQVIHLIFTDYIGRKQYEISNIEKKGRILKNQVSWIYNSNCEVHLLQEIIDEIYFQLDEQNIKSILNFYIDLIRLNLIRAKQAGYSKVRLNRYDDLYVKAEEKIFDVIEWKDVILKIYQKLSDKKKQELIRLLQRGLNQGQDFYEQYYKQCINDLIRVEFDCIFSEKRKQKDFVKIFGQIIKDKYFNDICAQIMRDKIIYYNRFDAGEIIGQLSGKNCTYIFSYIVLYYSIYRFRFEWEYININVLRILWKQHSDMQDDAEEVIEKIRNSNIGHRFEDKMYFKFMEYINASADGELFNMVYNDKILDVFYVWVIKTSVINQDDLIYSIYQDNLDMDIQIAIINELAKHDELMECESIHTWVQYMRYNSFAMQNSFPRKLNITLRSLLLTNINVVIVVNYVHENRYFYDDVIGAYLLVKLHELSDKTQKQKQIKEIVKNAFIASNMDIDEYINMIEKECYMCRCEINYVQKEKMKEYLLQTF